eukprot:scaffold210969_cov80-Attheya_sp.AAC.1
MNIRFFYLTVVLLLQHQQGSAEPETCEYSETCDCAEEVDMPTGFGRAVYLPTEDVYFPHASPKTIFRDTTTECSSCHQHLSSVGLLVDFDSMEKLVEKSSSSIVTSSSITENIHSMEGSALRTTGQLSETTSTFHSTNLKVQNTVNHVQYKDTCMTYENIDGTVMDKFNSLPLPSHRTEGNFIENNLWPHYNSFLTNHGSHIIVAQFTGSLFEQWVSSTSTASDVQHSIRAKACAEVEGVSPDGGYFSVSGCLAYTEGERQIALKTETANFRVALGGSKEANTALPTEGPVPKETLDAFKQSAGEGTESIETKYKKVWQLYNDIFTERCKDDLEDACDGLQRAKLLEAAYTGVGAFGCTKKTSGDVVYEGLRFTAPDPYGIHDIECWERHTGSKSDNDCHSHTLGCFAYGATAFDKQNLPGTEKYKTIVRLKKSGGVNDGINKSCHRALGCDHSKPFDGMLFDRTIWMSG